MSVPSLDIAEDKAFLALGTADIAERLRMAIGALSGHAVFTTSFGMEDQILTHFIVESGLDIDFVTLDTGRLFPETYDVWAMTEAKYKIKVEAFSPNADDIKALYKAQGVNGFYDGVDERKTCCHIRKVVPLTEALKGADIWISGLRSEQAASRQNLSMISHDEGHDVVKFNPLLDWTKSDMTAFLNETKGVPLNSLHKKGYPSIGCQPCTRAITEGEDDRAGRWWWENDNQECGLHVGPDGRLTRGKANT